MRTAMAVALAISLLCVPTEAQDKPESMKITLRSYGDSSQTALEAFAAKLGYGVILPSEGDDVGGSIEDACWFSIKDASVEQASAVLSRAFGLRVTVHHDRKKVSAHSYMTTTRRVTRGYDVSLLCARYVDYVNRFNGAKPAKGFVERPASSHLLDHMLGVMEATGLRGDSGSAVGQRLLFTLEEGEHAQVKELLNLLMNEKGGASVACVAQRQTLEALGKVTWDEEVTERPVASLLAALFAKAGRDFVITYGMARELGEAHVTRAEAKGQNGAALLADLTEAHQFGLGAVAGVALLGDMTTASWGSYRVFELKPLLERLAQDYVNQRTKPRDGGFEGDISNMGGLAVITSALQEQGEGRELPCTLKSFGTRLVALGSAQTLDELAAILKEMGFEEPKED